MTTTTKAKQARVSRTVQAAPAAETEAAPANAERLSLIRNMVRRKKIHGRGYARSTVAG